MKTVSESTENSKKQKCTDCDLLSWLDAETDDVKFYWSDRDGNLEWAGSGIIEETGLPEEAAEMAKRGRIFAVNAFPGTMSDEWRDVSAVRFFRPVRQMWKTQGNTFCNFDLVKPYEAVAVNQNGSDGKKAFLKYHQPEKAMYCDAVKSTQAEISQGNISKRVLARKSVFEVKGNLSALEAFLVLRKAASKSFSFFYQMSNATAFFGVSPERLVSVNDGAVLSEALAGTRRRSANAAEDERLTCELLESAKDINEQQWVTKRILSGLDNVCIKTYSQERRILKLDKVQHLLTPIAGTLRENKNWLDAALAIHPTPAVGGVGTGAVEGIAALEGFCRGYYAGFIGCAENENADLAVAIRSALYRDGKITAYTGAGIVVGSDAESEWDELEAKLEIFKQAFGG